MRLAVIAVGRLKGGPERDLVERYRARIEGIGRGLGIAGPDLLELPESRARRVDDRQTEEAAGLLARAGPGARLVAFDERGRSPTSEAFSDTVRRWRDAGAPMLACLLGGPDGFADDIRKKADLLVSFGALTVPHQLARVLVVEQLYRALTILAGHPYHRTGE